MSAIKAESLTYFAALGKQVAMLRKARKFTQAEVARAVGVSPQTIFHCEIGGRVSVLVLARIARMFEVSVEDLIDIARPLPHRIGRLSPRAMRHAERLQSLQRTDQRFVIRLIDLLEDRSVRARH